MVDDARAVRARRRASWHGELLTEQTPAQLSTAAERVGSMWQLALDAFGLDNVESDTPRSEWPGRLVRG